MTTDSLLQILLFGLIILAGAALLITVSAIIDSLLCRRRLRVTLRKYAEVVLGSMLVEGIIFLVAIGLVILVKVLAS